MRRYLVLLVLPGLAAAGPSFSKDIAPLFATRCAGCHNARGKMGGLDLTSFESAMRGGATGRVIVPGKSADSRMIQLISGKAAPSMPMDGTKLTPEQVASIAGWIDAGAPGPAAGEVSVVAAPKIVLPRIAPLAAQRPQIFDLAFLPGGKLIAVAGFREVRLVDTGSGAVVRTLAGAADTVRALAVSPDGSLIAAAGGRPAQSGEVKIWDAGGREITNLRGHSDCIYAVAFSPDGKRIATGSYDKAIKLWDVATGKEIRTLKEHIDAVYALAFTPDGSRLLSGAADRTVKVWDLASGQRLYTISDAQDGINALALDPTGKRVVTGGGDKTLRVYELGDGKAKLTATLIAHEAPILRVAWSPDGKWILSSASDRTVKLVNAADLNELNSWTASDWVYGLAWSPDSSRFAMGRFDGGLIFSPAHARATQVATRSTP